MNNDLDFTGLKFINPGEYTKLNHDEKTCVALAQMESLSVFVRVYQVDKNNFTGAIKGNIAAVGRESVVQEVDRRFAGGSDIPHMIIHKKSDLFGADIKPGDEVVISYSRGAGHVIPVEKDARYAYEIDFDGAPELLEKITNFIRDASSGGRVKMTSDRIAEVVGNAITNASLSALAEFGTKRPELIAVEITEHIKALDLKSESVRVSEKLLKSHQVGYRIDLQDSIKPQVVFSGARPSTSSHQKLK